MHRAILEACLPCLIALAVALAALVFVVRLSGCRPHWRRLREVHSCQDGGVQSLAFVLTLPLFIVIVQFIVQVSQLMIATMVVNYAAFAAARSAVVWIPAYVEGEDPELFGHNRLDGITSGRGNGVVVTWNNSRLEQSEKYRQIFAAATIACSPVAPSRDLNAPLPPLQQETARAMTLVYQEMVPSARQNQRIPRRISNKVAYSSVNTILVIEFIDKNSANGPTYNPIGHPSVHYRPHEFGWQDPVTVHVVHRFALMPGAGRLLARQLVRADGLPDRVSQLIEQDAVTYSEPVYSVAIPASATFTSEGLKSVRPPRQSLP